MKLEVNVFKDIGPKSQEVLKMNVNIEKEKPKQEESVKERHKIQYENRDLDNFGNHLIRKILTFELMNNRLETYKLKGYGQFYIMIGDSRRGQDIILIMQGIISI